MNISICLDALFAGKDIIQSMKDVKSCGIDTVEFWGWWDKDIKRIAQAREELDMEVSVICTRSASLVDDSKHDEFYHGLEETIEVAKMLKCGRVIALAGNEIAGIEREIQHENMVKGLKKCVPLLEEEGITIVFEPLNIYVDHKGYYLYSSQEAYSIAKEVNSANVKVLFDIYHQQIMEGNLISNIKKSIDYIGHFHAAGNPGRHELTKGEINYNEVFKSIDEIGYNGFIGFEYFPQDDVLEGIKEWVK